MAENSVIVARKGATAIIRLNEPKSMNALSATIRDGLVPALSQASDDPEVRAIILTGTDGAFCAGGDIRNMGVRRAPAIRTRMQGTHKWIADLLKTEKPVITAVNGAAAGAGFSLSLLGDIIIAQKDAYFMTSFMRLGACPDLGLLATLPRAIGMARAKDLLLSSRKVSADEAWQMGLISRVVEPGKLMDTAMETAETLAAAPTVTIGVMKRLLLRAYDTSIENFLDEEAFGQAIAQSTEDFEEGAKAFREKRKPAFKGR